MTPSATAQTRSRDTHGNRIQPDGMSRHRALVRLYQRRAAVDQLIQALERYQQDPGQRSERQVEGLSVAGRS